MNDMIEVTTDQPGTALAVIRTALPTILAADQNDILGKLAEKVAAFIPDISTAKGRKECASLAAQVASAKMDLVRLGKGLTENWRKSTAAVNAECRVIEEKMDALKRHVRAPLDAYEAAEEARIKANDDAIATLEHLAVWLGTLTVAEIEERQTQAMLVAEFDWSIEFRVRAERVVSGVMAQLRLAGQDAVRREEEARAEDARAAAEAEANRLATIEAQRVREERIAAEAAETARLEAEAKAAREAEVAAAAVKRAQEDAEGRAQQERDAAAEREREAAEALAEAERRAEHEREIAAQVAARAEAGRVAGHQTALATMRKLATPLAPPDPVPVIDAKRAQLEDVSSRDWEEFDDQARATFDECHATLTASRAESVRLDAEAAERKLHADAEAEAKRQAAAVEAERQRAAEVKRAEDAETTKRAANRAHQAKINGAAMTALLRVMSEVDAGNADNAEMVAKAIVIAIAKGEIPHCRLEY